jgi:hypothetical protein
MKFALTFFEADYSGLLLPVKIKKTGLEPAF